MLNTEIVRVLTRHDIEAIILQLKLEEAGFQFVDYTALCVD